MVKFILKLLVIAIACHCIGKYCQRKTGGFTILKIHSNLLHHPEWEVENPSLDHTIFDQSFSYLGRGGQCYAFVSEDGQYVIKFFKHYLRRLPFWLKVLPLPPKWNAKKELQRQKRLNKLHRDFGSYKIAYENLPSETGLLFLHLNKTDNLHQTVRIIDRLKIEHTISLDGIEFILQKKATMAYPYLTQLIKNGKIDEAKRALESICHLILSRCEKGIFDEDAKIHRNFGFIENEAILIDVGRLKLDINRKDPSIQEKDLKEITQRLQTYLEGLSPELAEYLEGLCHV